MRIRRRNHRHTAPRGPTNPNDSTPLWHLLLIPIVAVILLGAGFLGAQHLRSPDPSVPAEYRALYDAAQTCVQLHDLDAKLEADADSVPEARAAQFNVEKRMKTMQCAQPLEANY